MSSGEVRKVSPEEIQLVQNLIEQCLSCYMTPKQVIDFLYQHQKIEPSFTELVWQKLEEQNREFFEGYHLRLMVKEQITQFNYLLNKQAALMNQMGLSGAGFRPMRNGSHMPAMHQNPSCYASDHTGIVMKTENMQQPVTTNLPSGFTNCGSSIRSGMQRAVDMSTHSRRTDVPPNTMLGQNSNIGTIQGMNGLAIKNEPGYLGNSRFVYGAGGNVLEAHPTIGGGGGASVSSFSSMDSDSHQLNGTLLDDTSSFELFGQISHNIDLPDLTADFTNNTDTQSYSKSAFLLLDRENFLDSHGNTAEHQGESKRLDAISQSLGFQDFGRDQ